MALTPDTFHFLEPDFDETSARMRLPYRFDDGPVLTEELRFPGARLPLDSARADALARALENLHLAAGVSYYKARVPMRITHYRGNLPAPAAAFFQRFYTKGLAEFAYRNGLNLADRVVFPVDEHRRWEALELPLAARSLVPLGGGKDSLVALELMRHAGREISLVSVGAAPLIHRVAARTGIPHIAIERQLAPGLFELNRQGAYNGHVPITGILGFVLVCAAILYDFDSIVMANERSASSGNIRLPNGDDVNHQYSKSLAFEQDFGTYIERHVLATVRYFSVLRPLSELAIAERFSRLTRYFDVFSSCNRNFRVAAGEAEQRWCRDCPKCRFVFLILAPFLNRERMIEIFGGDLLDDVQQAAGFDALIERGAHKPFECVGEAEESLAALVMLSRLPEWRGASLVRRFRDEVLPRIADPDALVQEAMAPAGRHRIPPSIENLVHAA